MQYCWLCRVLNCMMMPSVIGRRLQSSTSLVTDEERVISAAVLGLK